MPAIRATRLSPRFCAASLDEFCRRTVAQARPPRHRPLPPRAAPRALSRRRRARLSRVARRRLARRIHGVREPARARVDVRRALPGHPRHLRPHLARRLARRINRPPLPPRPVLITFDDGYRSVFTIGAPMLAAHGLPAVVFACSDPVARRALLWFDAVAARDGEAAVEPWKGRDYAPWLAACARGTQAVSDTDARA